MPKLASKPATKTSRPPMVDPEETEAETPAPEPEKSPEPVAAEGPVTPKPESAPKAQAQPPVRRPAAKKTSAAPLKGLGGLFTPLDDVTEFYNVMYWGREGSSKTTAIASAANRGRILIINAEGGLKKVALRRQGINTDNIQVWPKPGEAITYEGLDEVYREIKADLEQDPDSWFAVGFDSATDIVATMVGTVSDNRLDKARAKGIDIDIDDQFTTDRNDYGVMAKQFRDIIRKFRDINCHVLISALERRDVDEDTGKVVYGPAVSPALQVDLLGYVDVVLYTRAADEDNDYFRAATKKAGKFRSKDRIGVLPAVMVNPTFERVLDYLEERVTPETDPEQEIIQRQIEQRAAAEKEREERKAALKSRATGSGRETAAQKRAREKREAESALAEVKEEAE